MRALLMALAIIALTSGNALSSVLCGERSEVVAKLKKNYSEVPVHIGLGNQQTVIEKFMRSDLHARGQAAHPFRADARRDVVCGALGVVLQQIVRRQVGDGHTLTEHFVLDGDALELVEVRVVLVPA